MKTPIQELIETFEEMNTGYKPTIDVSLALSFMRSMLEKEKEMIVRSFMNVSDDRDRRLEDVHLREFAEDYYNKTFKTKER